MSKLSVAWSPEAVFALDHMNRFKRLRMLEKCRELADSGNILNGSLLIIDGDGNDNFFLLKIPLEDLYIAFQFYLDNPNIGILAISPEAMKKRSDFPKPKFA